VTGRFTRPAPARARMLRPAGLAGLAAAGADGFLGGHLAYRQSAGANQAEPVPHLVEPGWHDLMPLDELDGRRPAKQMLGSPAAASRAARWPLPSRCSAPGQRRDHQLCLPGAG
jgi:hypothetical protein